MGALDVDSFRVIDCDTHVNEPADLWTARMSSKWGDLIPHVRWDDERQEEFWYLRNERIIPAAFVAMAGWDGYPPHGHPRRLEEVDPVMTDPRTRLTMMDEYGIYAEVLYPNVGLFHGGSLLSAENRQLQNEINSVYNDWLTEWSQEDPQRLLPMATLPFWDLDASIAELKRAAEMGHRGVILSQDPSYFGAPHLDDTAWDPLWALAQEAGMPINFHIASGDMTGLTSFGGPQMEDEARYAASTVLFSWGNAKAIATLIAGGVCERFPDLNFVSVESGIGWMPYLVAYLDWQFANSGSKVLSMTPTEYFKRQIYGCFWFEDKTARLAIEALGPDNFLYESDFPHPTSMTPGPASAAVMPREYIQRTLGDLPDDVVRKVLHDNAARIYHLDPLP
ncbi:MAG: amidohydrolase family protein [Acidimicrobiia bacterium]